MKKRGSVVVQADEGVCCSHMLLYLFSYELVVFPFQNSPKNFDPSYKMGPNIQDCFGREKNMFQPN